MDIKCVPAIQRAGNNLTLAASSVECDMYSKRVVANSVAPNSDWFLERTSIASPAALRMA